MKFVSEKHPNAAELREMAESKLAKQSSTPVDGSADTLKLLHELQVHQIELEMQNEALVAAQASLETALHRYAELYDLAPVAYFTIDRAGNIVSTNLRGGNLLAIGLGITRCKRFHDVVKDSDLPVFNAFLEKLILNQAHEACRLELKAATPGKRIIVQIEGNSVHDSQTYRFVALNVTNQFLAQEESERSNAELEQFAYVASHDLREPLRMISSYMALLERRLASKLDTDSLEFIHFAKDGATRMNGLILDLLDFSRVGRMGDEIKKINARAALDDALLNLEPAIKAADADLVIVGNFPDLVICQSELVRLFQNLVANALKYADPSRKCRIEITAGTVDDNILFSVADNGIGIEPNKGYEERIFKVFQRLHAHDAYGGGSGIGLAICHKIVRRHGGRIWVVSEGEGKGAVFNVTLPIYPVTLV
jgi:signal transduction histidine kinase